MRPKHKRFVFVGLGLGLLAVAAGLVLSAFEESVVFFRSPSEVAAQPPVPERRIRLGGLVEEGSLKREAEGRVRFVITDLAESVPVVYQGLLPDLFREGQGVVAEGAMTADGLFRADEVLAKHDENYMPPEVAEALEASGQWQHMKDSMERAGQKMGPPSVGSGR